MVRGSRPCGVVGSLLTFIYSIALLEGVAAESPARRTIVRKGSSRAVQLVASGPSYGESRPLHWRERPPPRPQGSLTAFTDGTHGGLRLGSRLTAVVLWVMSSVFTVVGLNLQKRAIAAQGVSGWWPQLGEAVLSPLWLSGFAIGVALPIPFHGMAYYLAPVSMLAPLSGVTVVLNFLVAPRILKERWEYWPDLPAAALIVFGMYVTTSTASLDQEEKPMSVRRFQDLMSSISFCVWGSFLLTAMVLSWVYQMWNRNSIYQAARAQFIKPPLVHILMVAVTAAGTSIFTNIGLKVAMSFLKAGMTHECLIALSCVLPMSAFHIQIVNYGMRLYQLMSFVPVCSALTLLGNTISGSIFFQEYGELLKNDSRWEMFVVGVVLVVVGISLLEHRAPKL